jgi:superfamily I DNA/RNA helicase
MTTNSKSQALGTIGRILRELGSDGDLWEADYLVKLGLTDREFREECLRLAVATPAPYAAPPSAFRSALASAVECQDRLGWTSSGLRTPNKDKWPGKPNSEAPTLRYSTVHGYKGLQEHGVALVIPDRSREQPGGGLFQWSSGTPGESRRVLYVGASRAEELLVVAGQASVYDAVRSTLERDDVPFDTV